MAEKPKPDDLESVMAEHLVRNINTVVNRLRYMADQLDADIERVEEIVERQARGFVTYASVIANVQHTVLWGLANLGLDNMTNNAYEADSARLAGE